MGTLRNVPPPVQDPVLGTVAWDPDEDAWVVHGQVAPFRILLAGEAGPAPRLLEHARDLARHPKRSLPMLHPCLTAAATLPFAKHEILGLRIERHLLDVAGLTGGRNDLLRRR